MFLLWKMSLLLKVGSWSVWLVSMVLGNQRRSMIIGLLAPYSGSINNNGLTLQGDATSYCKQIGYIPETPSLYEELTSEHIGKTAKCITVLSKSIFWTSRVLLKMFRLEQIRLFLFIFQKGWSRRSWLLSVFCGDPSLFIGWFSWSWSAGYFDLIQLWVDRRKSILMSTYAGSGGRCVMPYSSQGGACQRNLLQLREAFDMPEASLKWYLLGSDKRGGPYEDVLKRKQAFL